VIGLNASLVVVLAAGGLFLGVAAGVVGAIILIERIERKREEARMKRKVRDAMRRN